MDVTLRIYSLDGTREVPLTSNRLTLGRTNLADIVINDNGLSRIHASINRDGDRIWVIDEGSTNGTLVNGNLVPPTGCVLKDGDEIDLGETSVVVAFAQTARAVVTPTGAPYQESRKTTSLPIPVIAAAAGVLIIVFAAIVIGIASRSKSDNGQITVKKYSGPSNNDDSDLPAPTTEPTSQPSTPTDPVETVSPVATDSPVVGPITPTKRYLAMTPEEQRQFIQDESQHVARMIGNRAGYSFTPEVVSKIKIWVDAYARRLHSPKPSGGCNMRHDLNTLLKRARSYAPVVVKAFNEKGLSPQVGLYLAMIEAEYCSCLSSGTGPKGYFQFASSTAKRYGVQDVSHWTDKRPDDRCKIDIMAPIAAQYMKDLISMFGTGPLSVPLAICSYNSGEGGLSKNLARALDAARNSDNPERSLWTMVAKADLLDDQFQREAVKYVPHFFGAAIVGENPLVFGVDQRPLSTYTQPETPASEPQPITD
ncbi:MAG: FHA domain-containing protein [Pyrinomonadaceae bacterium]